MNFAIIGCGVIAQTHARALRLLEKEGCRLYALCDIVPEKADALGREYGAERIYYEDEEVFADPKVDVVCVCVPSGTHGQICIEAARAGTAGKGFAVVADEVRSLASQSDQAAKATKDLIENSVSATTRGSSIVDEVSQSLRRTQELVTQSNASMQEIDMAIQSEAQAISQVTEGIGQISAVVQTNSASSEESAAVSTELFDQVRMLQDQTRRFKLRQGRLS